MREKQCSSVRPILRAARRLGMPRLCERSAPTANRLRIRRCASPMVCSPSLSLSLSDHIRNTTLFTQTTRSSTPHCKDSRQTRRKRPADLGRSSWTHCPSLCPSLSLRHHDRRSAAVGSLRTRLRNQITSANAVIGTRATLQLAARVGRPARCCCCISADAAAAVAETRRSNSVFLLIAGDRTA